MSALYHGSFSEGEEEIGTYQAVSDPLAIIYNEGLWRINKVSPLNKMQYSAVKLKQYASKVRQTLVRMVQGKPTLKYSVKFEEQTLLKYSEIDENGLLITVSSANENSTNTAVAYTAVLLSWGLCSSFENTVHLPYMLERGEQKVGSAVKSSLQTIFDCHIVQFTFTQTQILHCGLKFVEVDTSRSNDTFTMVYKTPQTEERNSLNLSFNVGDIRIIWNGVRNEEDSSSKQVYLAHQILQNQIFSMSSLDVSLLDLCEINLPKAEIRNIGAVKMKTPEAVNRFFILLNEICNNNKWIDGSSNSL